MVTDMYFIRLMKKTTLTYRELPKLPMYVDDRDIKRRDRWEELEKGTYQNEAYDIRMIVFILRHCIGSSIIKYSLILILIFFVKVLSDHILLINPSGISHGHRWRRKWSPENKR